MIDHSLDDLGSGPENLTMKFGDVDGNEDDIFLQDHLDKVISDSKP